MSHQILDIVLFWSQFSKESLICIDFIKKFQLPITLVKLDTAEARSAALNGNKINITAVPSLLVEFNNGKTNIYQGRPKVIAWLQAMMNRSQVDKSPQRKTVQKQLITEDFDTKDYKILERESHVEIKQPKLEKSPKKPLRVKEKGRKKSKKILEEPLELIGGDDDGLGTELIFEDTPYEEPQQKSMQSPSKGFQTASKPNNSSIMTDVKKMMAQRDATLGYGAEKHG